MTYSIIKKSKTLLQKTSGMIVFFAIWEIAPRVGLVDQIFIPPFSVVATTFVGLVISGKLPYHAFISLKRSLLGFILGMVISIPLGIMIGMSHIFERFVDPVVQSFRQTSSLALLPIFMLLFGIGETSKILIILWGVQWPILLSTISGVKNVDPLLIKCAKSMGTNRLNIFRKVILPAAIPSIFTGIRLGGTYSILMLIAAEMIGADSGLGYFIFDSQVKYAIPEMYSAIVSIAILGLILNYILVHLEKSATKWKEDIASI